MKKISLLLVVLLAAGSASLYGQMDDRNGRSTVTGDATATVGYDIDDEQFGFKNESNSSIKLELVPESSVNNGGDGRAWKVGYGYIELNDFKIVIDSGEEDSPAFVTGATATPGMDDMMMPMVDVDNRDGPFGSGGHGTGSIVAKLKNGPLFLKIFAAPDQVADLVAAIEDDEDDDNDRRERRPAQATLRLISMVPV